MNDHAVDAMLYVWLVMKEKGGYKIMEYINFGKVVNVSASVPVAVNDTVYHIIIDFVPNCPEIFDSFHTDMGKILEWPDDYVLCNVSDIKELEDLGADLNEHIKNLERIKEFLINGNTTLIGENSKLKATNQTLKDRIKELEGQLADAKKESDKKLCEAYMETNAVLYNSAYKFISFDKEFAEIKKDRDYWKARFGSVVEDFSKTLAANGVEFSMLIQEVSGNGKWEAIIDIPELNELKAENERLKTKVDDLFNERGVLQAKLVKRGAELECVKSENSELKKDLKAANDQLDKMDADIDELKNKNRDLEKELAESKTFAEAEYRWYPDGSFTATYTRLDGTKDIIGMDLSGDIDATSISCGTIPKCSSCSHFMHNPSRYAHDWCYKPIPKEGAGTIRKLSKEEAEGPACSEYKAKE